MLSDKLIAMMKLFSILILFLFLLLTFAKCKKDCLKSDQCNLNPVADTCLAAIPKYYHDKKEGKCKEFTWGGCGVVPFDTLEECKKHCGCN